MSLPQERCKLFISRLKKLCCFRDSNLSNQSNVDKGTQVCLNKNFSNKPELYVSRKLKFY